MEGNPPPYVAWINVTDGSVLQNRTVNTNYVIPNVSSLHKGTYRCVMENRCGNDSKVMNITDVYCKFVTHVHMLILLALYSVNNRLLNVSVVRKF